MKDGIVIINKPQGITSHDVVDCVRRRFRIKRVGHAGTLDPLATGVLIILIGKATKLFKKFVNFDKAYQATMLLGTTTNTADIQGQVLQRRSYAHVTQQQLEEVIQRFVGEIEQIPPMVSALKVGGKRLYDLARKGIEIKREPRKIRVDALRWIHYSLPEIGFYMECSKGTYVRKLAEDVGEALQCGACISQIERIKVGPYSIDEAIRLEDLQEIHIRPLQGLKFSK